MSAPLCAPTSDDVYLGPMGQGRAHGSQLAGCICTLQLRGTAQELGQVVHRGDCCSENVLTS